MRAITVAFFMAVAMTASTLAVPSKNLPSIKRNLPKQEIRAIEDLDIKAILKQLPLTLVGIKNSYEGFIVDLDAIYGDEPELAKIKESLDQAVASAEKEITKFLALAPLLIPFPERLQALVEKTVANLTNIAQGATSEVYDLLVSTFQNNFFITIEAVVNCSNGLYDAIHPLHLLLIPILP